MIRSSQKPARVSAILRSSTRGQPGEAGPARTPPGARLRRGGHEIRASSRSDEVRDRNSSSRPPPSAGRSSSSTMPAAAATRPTASASASTSSAPSAPGVATRPAPRERLVQGGGVERADDHAGGGQQLVLAALGDDPAVADHDEAGRRPPRPRAAGARRAARCRRGRRSRAAGRASRRCPRGRGRSPARRGSARAGRRSAPGRCRAAGACRASSCATRFLAAARREADALEQLVDARGRRRRGRIAEMVSASRPVRPACWADASSSTPTSRPGLGRLR